MTDVTAAYSRRAAEYTEKIGSMVSVDPADQLLVEAWALSVNGRILDARCGPGHWTNHLAQLGVDVRGIDRVPDFIEHARSTYPGVQFDIGSIESINEADGTFGGILSWFSTIHHDPSRIAAPLGEFARVLGVGGSLVLGYFDASDEVQPFDHAVVRAYRWPISALRIELEATGFAVVEVHRRAEPGQRPVGAVVCRLVRAPGRE